MRPYLLLSLFLFSSVCAQDAAGTTFNTLDASSYLGLLAETTASEGFSAFDGEEESEVEKVSRALLEPRQGTTCTAGPGGPQRRVVLLVVDAVLGDAVRLQRTAWAAVDAVPKSLKLVADQPVASQGLPAAHLLPLGAAPLGQPAVHPRPPLAARLDTRAVETPAAHPAKHANGTHASTPVCCTTNIPPSRKSHFYTGMLTSKRVVRFELNEKKNGALLRNMCNGMRGENTIELTYSGQMSDSDKRKKRTAAGCVSGYCAKLAVPGLNSCDEFPPASSDEGGSTIPRLQRAINCIPGTQNSRQGQRFSAMVRSSGIRKGQRFVISIDCDEVLGSIVPRNADPFDDYEEEEDDLAKRDVVDLSGTSDSENIFTPESSLNETTNTLIVDFGDLGAGSYQVEFTVETGSIEAGGFIVDNLGDQLANVTSTSALQTGDTERLAFDIEADGELMGVGLILPTRNTATTISWKFVGEDLRPSSSRSTQSPASTDGPSDASSAVEYNTTGTMGRPLLILLSLMLLLNNL
ncbi:hypothetical protein BKA70DRAFT_1574876 [Coprinopsis sp. MPI-PUGE-AT-0042]|nr:hypothetical protein BKA70DRAFT_1574876 [Coprinopsis sp. MPI-PUGE-AT-0042]